MTPWHAITPAWVHPVKTLNAAVHAAQTPAGPLAVTTGCAIVPGQPHRYVTPHHHQEVTPPLPLQLSNQLTLLRHRRLPPHFRRTVNRPIPLLIIPPSYHQPFT